MPNLKINGKLIPTNSRLLYIKPASIARRLGGKTAIPQDLAGWVPFWRVNRLYFWIFGCFALTEGIFAEVILAIKMEAKDTQIRDAAENILTQIQEEANKNLSHWASWNLSLYKAAKPDTFIF